MKISCHLTSPALGLGVGVEGVLGVGAVGVVGTSYTYLKLMVLDLVVFFLLDSPKLLFY